MKKLLVFLFISIVLVLVFSCSSSSNGDTSVKQSGIVQVSGSFNQPPATSSKSISSSISRIGAVSVVLGQLTTESIDEMILGEVNVDGSFSIDLPQEEGTEYMLALIDDNAVNQFDRIPGFVSLPLDDSTQLESLPVAGSETDIDLGLLEQTENDALADVDLETLQDWFGLSFAEIVQAALLDDEAKNLKNNINNTDPITGEYFWIQQRTSILKSLTTAVNQFSTPGPPYITDTFPDADLLDTDRMLYVDVDNSDAQTLEAIADGTINIEVFPNQEVYIESPELGVQWYGPQDPITTENDLRITILEPDEANFAFEFRVNSNAPIVYDVFYSGVQKASIDTGFFRALDDEGNYRYVFPILKINTDNSFHVESMELLFYLYDSIQDRYTEIEDPSILGRFGRFSLEIRGVVDSGDGSTEYRAEIFEGETYIDSFEYDWTTTGNPGVSDIYHLDIGVWLGQSSIFNVVFMGDYYF
jgi:hypothetical protein